MTIEDFRIKYEAQINSGAIKIDDYLSVKDGWVSIKDSNKHSGVFFTAPKEISEPRMALKKMGYKYNGINFLKL